MAGLFSDPTNPNQARELMPLAEPQEPPRERTIPPGFKDRRAAVHHVSQRRSFWTGRRKPASACRTICCKTTIALPFPTRDKPIFITPYFQAHILQGPEPVDLPPQVYDVSLEFRILRQLNPRWGMDSRWRHRSSADFKNMSSQAYRLTGRLAFLFTWTPTAQLAMGVTATGR